MSLTRKRQLLAGVLVLMAVWPLAHHALATSLELNPWRFFGWSMYARPWNQISLRLVDATGGQAREVERPVLDAAAAELRAYRRERATWGRLAEPDAVARAVLRLDPRIQALSIEVENLLLSPTTSLFEPRVQRYGYPRSPDRGRVPYPPAEPQKEGR